MSSSTPPAQKRDAAILNPKTTSYEFLGPPGAFLVTTLTSAICYLLYFGCNESGCLLYRDSFGAPRSLPTITPESIPDRVLNAVQDVDFWKSLWDRDAAIIYAGWYAFCVISWAILPGDWVEGTTLRTGEKKKYKINAFTTMLLALGCVSGHIWRNGPEAFTFLYEKWVGLITAAIINSVFQACYVYAMSFRQGKLLALGGNSGNFLYDWFIGRELNPTVFGLDLKSFNELRPGLILWVLLDVSCLCEQAVRLGGFENVTPSMYLAVWFHFFYVADGLYNEPALFTTMDIVSDGFGYMLAVGDLAWVPFVYSVQARYLAFHPTQLSTEAVVGIFALHCLGYYIFRTSNSDKNNFRNGNNPKNLKWMQTKRGTKLLVSGWWGVSQHPNYLGDWIMAVAWCLPTAFATPVTYIYPIYFAVLLIHRQRRDDEACHLKYGEDWLEYKKRVPYRIVPYIY